MRKIILGLTGEIASGKGTAVEYLKKKYGASAYRFSDPIRDALTRLHLENSRAHMQTMSSILRQNFGDDLFSKAISFDVKKDKNPVIVIDGIRRPADVIYLQKLPNFRLVYITADIKARYERLVKRGENPDEREKTFRQFQIDNRAEPEMQILEISRSANETIDNNGPVDKLYRQLDNIIKG